MYLSVTGGVFVSIAWSLKCSGPALLKWRIEWKIAENQ